MSSSALSATTTNASNADDANKRTLIGEMKRIRNVKTILVDYKIRQFINKNKKSYDNKFIKLIWDCIRDILTEYVSTNDEYDKTIAQFENWKLPFDKNGVVINNETEILMCRYGEISSYKYSIEIIDYNEMYEYTQNDIDDYIQESFSEEYDDVLYEIQRPSEIQKYFKNSIHKCLICKDWELKPVKHQGHITTDMIREYNENGDWVVMEDNDKLQNTITEEFGEDAILYDNATHCLICLEDDDKLFSIHSCGHKIYCKNCISSNMLQFQFCGLCRTENEHPITESCDCPQGYEMVGEGEHYENCLYGVEELTPEQIGFLKTNNKGNDLKRHFFDLRALIRRRVEEIENDGDIVYRYIEGHDIQGYEQILNIDEHNDYYDIDDNTIGEAYLCFKSMY